jgi:hypothetical protein
MDVFTANARSFSAFIAENVTRFLRNKNNKGAHLPMNRPDSPAPLGLAASCTDDSMCLYSYHAKADASEHQER